MGKDWKGGNPVSYTLTITTGTTCGGIPLSELALAGAREWAHEEILALFGGVTLTHGCGSWKDSGKIIREPVDIYTIHGELPGEDWKELAREICQAYGQECVAVAKVDAEFVLVSGTPWN